MIDSRKMEYLMPYTRLKATVSTGMQLNNVKKIEHQETSSDSVLLATATNLVNSKKIQKHVLNQQALNQQFKHLKNPLDVDFSPTKMSKKQLKLAQDQLKKLTKINIHLHGKSSNFCCLKFNFHYA